MNLTKQTYRLLYRSVNRALAGLLALLGFSACDTLVEYGAPYVAYSFKGKVTGVAGKPVRGIRIGYGHGGQPAISDDRGEFKLTATTDMASFEYNAIVHVYIDDIDGEANGSYAPDTLAVDFRNAVQTGKPDGWYKGEYTVNAQIELKEQPPHE